MRKRNMLSTRFALPAITAGAAVAARWFLDRWLGNQLPLVTLFAGVAAAVWWGGYRPAIVAAIAGYLACDFLFIEPRGGFGLDSAASLVGALAYTFSCAVIIGFGEALRRARAGVRTETQLLRTTLASIGAGVVTTDLEGRVTYLNVVAEALTGWPLRDALGKPLAEVFRIVNERTRAPVGNPAMRALREGIVVGLANHTLLIARDGTERPIDDSAAPIRDSLGETNGCVLVFRDVTERRAAEKALHRSEQELRDFFENATVGLHWVGPDGIILRANQTELDLLGYASHEYLGRHIREFHVDGPVIDDILARLARGETVCDQPARLRSKDGSIREVIINSSALFEDGRFVHTRCFTRDVTEINRAHEARERLAAIVDSSADAIVGKNLDGVIQSWNAAAEGLFGYTRDEAVGRHISLVVPRDRLQEEETILARLARGERIEHFETTRVAKDGRLIDIGLTISPIHDAHGQIVGASKVARDVGERKRIHAVLENARRIEEAGLVEFQTLIQHAPAAIWVARDPECRVITGNPAAAAMMRVPSGSNMSKSAPPSEQPSHVEILRDGKPLAPEELPMQQAAHRGIAMRDQELEFRFEDGTSNWGYGTAVPLFDERGGVRGVVATFIDITERKRAEQALRDADRRKDEFLATLAHELRNPLAPIRNSIEIMKQAEKDPQVMQRSRATLDRQVAQMERLIDDILDISRITTNRLELRKQEVELASVLHHAAEMSRPLFERLGHLLTVTLPESPVYLEGDPVRLSQVFGNLLNNACKYTPRGGRISVTADSRPGEVVVSVADDGVGIPPEMLPRIFDVFVQVEGALEHSQGGLGIGLTLVRQLVALHHGSVEARSEGPGRGSTFVVRLPALPAPKGLTAPAPEAAKSATTSARVLVVDDNRDSADSLAMLLQLAAHESRVAYDGHEALAEAERFLPQLVLLDLGLPGISGFEVCRRIRAQPWGKRMHIVALSGWGQEEDRRKSRAAGFDEHLVKPIERASLLGLLASVLASDPPPAAESSSDNPMA